ncbi:MAG: GNAT family N-acetyltransferase [Acidobacteriota bacterium]|nr:GNAT family N-acetyltransferase [Acidobacteriota bacterium]
MELGTDIQDCVLRLWTASDKPNLIRYANDKAVSRNLLDAFPYPYSDADAEFWIAHTQANPGMHFAITVGGEAVGGIGIDPQSGVASRTAHFGYWLGQRFWGKGFATAAARVMASYTFQAFEFARLEAPVFAWNPASMRVLEKAGFSREGVLRQSVYKHGELIDSVLYAKLRVV